jgi:hypothetical protein
MGTQGLQERAAEPRVGVGYPASPRRLRSPRSKKRAGITTRIQGIRRARAPNR